MSNKICFLEYESKYYIINKNFFRNDKFVPLSLNEIMSAANENLNQDFIKKNIKLDDGTVIDSSDYIDFKKCKIRYMDISKTLSSPNSISITFNYMQSDESLKNTEVKINQKQVNNIIEFVSNNLQSIHYSINSQDYKEALIKNYITEKEFTLKVLFNNNNCNLEKINFMKKNSKYKKLKNCDIDIFRNKNDTSYLRFKKNFNKVFINYLKKENTYVKKHNLEVIE